MTAPKEAGFGALLAALKEAHAAHPEIRVGQLIYNVLVRPTNGLPCPSLYYAEDGELAEKIRAYARGEDPAHG